MDVHISKWAAHTVQENKILCKLLQSIVHQSSLVSLKVCESYKTCCFKNVLMCLKCGFALTLYLFKIEAKH